MATATAQGAAAVQARARFPVPLLLLALISFAYAPFLYAVFTYPAARQFGYATLNDIAIGSALFFMLVLVLAMLFWNSARPAPRPVAVAQGAAATASQAAAPGSPRVRRVTAQDPSSRPGAPLAYNLPAGAPDGLQGGWQRYKFPAERTGGVYIDVDVRIDDLTRPRTDEGTPRGLYILRVRDEVARVCVQCDLISHCHGKVAALITREEMRGNFECVPGLKKMVNAKIASMKKPKEQPPAKNLEVAAAPAPSVEDGPLPAPFPSPAAAPAELPPE